MDSFNEMKTRIKVKIKISRIRIMMRMGIRDALIKKKQFGDFSLKGGVCLLGENFRFVPVFLKGRIRMIVGIRIKRR